MTLPAEPPQTTTPQPSDASPVRTDPLPSLLAPDTTPVQTTQVRPLHTPGALPDHASLVPVVRPIRLQGRVWWAWRIVQQQRVRSKKVEKEQLAAWLAFDPQALGPGIEPGVDPVANGHDSLVGVLLEAWVDAQMDKLPLSPPSLSDLTGKIEKRREDVLDRHEGVRENARIATEQGLSAARDKARKRLVALFGTRNGQVDRALAWWGERWVSARYRHATHAARRKREANRKAVERRLRERIDTLQRSAWQYFRAEWNLVGGPSGDDDVISESLLADLHKGNTVLLEKMIRTRKSFPALRLVSYGRAEMMIDDNGRTILRHRSETA